MMKKMSGQERREAGKRFLKDRTNALDKESRKPSCNNCKYRNTYNPNEECSRLGGICSEYEPMLVPSEIDKSIQYFAFIGKAQKSQYKQTALGDPDPKTFNRACNPCLI